MNYHELHPWKIGYRRAVSIQQTLRKRLLLIPPAEPPRLIAGADASYVKHSDLFYSAVVVFSLEPWRLVEQAVARGRVRFPYIPGLLSFREAPILLKAFKNLKAAPDLIIFDSQGIAHPRGLGLAAHMGLLLNTSTIGCAKSRLIGTYRTPGTRTGCRTTLIHEGKRVGTVVRTRDGIKPVFVSPGHLMDHRGAVRWVLRCCRGYRLPEPTRCAHILVNQIRRGDTRHTEG